MQASAHRGLRSASARCQTAAMDRILRAPAFRRGLTEVVSERDGELGLGLQSLRLSAGATWQDTSPLESALLVFRGGARLRTAELEVRARRDDPFAALSHVLLVPPREPVTVEAEADVEVLRVTTANDARFAPRAFGPDDAFVDRRGEDGGDGAAFRFVRTYFDRRNAPPESRLVVGEVVNLPGRWSSYPPHHHAQPELYHYRFRPEHGYGHAEHGDDVFKVRHGDTLRIAPGHDHAQCAAPGYAMLYVWAIRHLDGQPYEGPTFAPDHEGAIAPHAPVWSPPGA